MSSIRRAGPTTLWTIQWLIAIAVFVVGMVDVGLSTGNPGRGLVLAVAAVALVVPSASRFFPALSPFVAAVLGFTLATGATSAFEIALAAGCVAVAFARGFLAPVEPADLRAEQASPLAPSEEAGADRHAPEPSPRRAGRPGRVHPYPQRFAHL